MSSRVALPFVRVLLVAAPLACHPQQGSNPGAEARGEGTEPTVAPDPTTATDAAATDAAAIDTTDAVAPTPEAEPPPEAAVPRAVRVVRSVTVGKWPEEVAVLGDDAFVATSGSRIIRQVDLTTGTVKQSIKAGTFPVSIVAGKDTVWAVDYNSRRTLFEIDAAGKANDRGKLPDHTETLAFADGIVFALLAKDDSSVNSSVVRFDPATAKQQRSEPTGKDPSGIAVGHGKVWAAAGGGVVVLSPESLAIEARIAVPSRLAEVFTNASSVYVASFADGSYARIDPATQEVTGTVAVGEPFVMAVRDDAVVTLGRSGTLAIWDPTTGAERVRLDVGVPIEGRWMTWYGEQLVVTAHGTSKDEKDGALHVLALE